MHMPADHTAHLSLQQVSVASEVSGVVYRSRSSLPLFGLHIGQAKKLLSLNCLAWQPVRYISGPLSVGRVLYLAPASRCLSSFASMS